MGNVTFPSPTLRLKKGDIAVGVNFTETQFGTDICAEGEIFARWIDDSIFNNNKKISKDKILSSLIEEDIVLTNEWQNPNLGDGVWLAPSEIANDDGDAYLNLILNKRKLEPSNDGTRKVKPTSNDETIVEFIVLSNYTLTL